MVVVERRVEHPAGTRRQVMRFSSAVISTGRLAAAQRRRRPRACRETPRRAGAINASRPAGGGGQMTCDPHAGQDSPAWRARSAAAGADLDVCSISAGAKTGVIWSSRPESSTSRTWSARLDDRVGGRDEAAALTQHRNDQAALRQCPRRATALWTPAGGGIPRTSSSMISRRSSSEREQWTRP